MTEALLDVRDLSVRFDTDEGSVHAVDRMSLTLEPREVLGIVGESGCGKSVTALSILGLLPKTASVSGSVLFEGNELLGAAGSRLRKVRGRQISFVFQEPMTSLNPVFRIGRQIEEVVQEHMNVSKRGARARALELLDLVHIPDPSRRVDEYPHQLSGGMRQRVMIAMALACDPKILIADEPTTALDVTIQAGILDLLREVRERLGTAIILITHNLGVVADLADRVVVMYAGRKAEEAPVRGPLRPPAAPVHDRAARRGSAGGRSAERPAPGDSGPGAVARRAPRLTAPSPTGARARTSNLGPRCPELREVRQDHAVACFHPGER